MDVFDENDEERQSTNDNNRHQLENDIGSRRQAHLEYGYDLGEPIDWRSHCKSVIQSYNLERQKCESLREVYKILEVENTKLRLKISDYDNSTQTNVQKKPPITWTEFKKLISIKESLLGAIILGAFLSAGNSLVTSAGASSTRSIISFTFLGISSYLIKRDTRKPILKFVFLVSILAVLKEWNLFPTIQKMKEIRNLLLKGVSAEAGADGIDNYVEEVHHIPISQRNIISLPKLAALGYQVNFGCEDLTIHRNQQLVCSIQKGPIFWELTSSLAISLPSPATFIAATKAKYIIPQTYADVLTSNEKDQWLAAIDSELQAIAEQQDYEVVPRNDESEVKSRWVFTVKVELDNSERFKARLVAKGFSQTFGQDYVDVFSPVLRFESLRFLLSHLHHKRYTVRQLDLKTLFLNGAIDYPVKLNYVNTKDALTKCLHPTTFTTLMNLGGCVNNVSSKVKDLEVNALTGISPSKALHLYENNARVTVVFIKL